MSIFCTSIHCMDGRVQEPIMKFLKENHGVEYVDTITEAGPCKILAESRKEILVNSIIERVALSIRRHKSKLIAISGHHDCAGNPCDRETQEAQIHQSVELLRNIHPDVEVVGLWIDDTWKVNSV